MRLKNIKTIIAFLTLSFPLFSFSSSEQIKDQENFKTVVNKPVVQSKTINRNSVWQDQIIYFVMTDRFNNGDRNNDFNVNTKDPWAYHGGDLQGLIDKLDYIRDLGVTAIWITPPMDNRDNAFKANFGNGRFVDLWAYHGYWAKDLMAIDEHLGTMSKMKEFVNKAHSKGIKVLIDIVMNHVDYDHPFSKDKGNQKNKYYKWFHQNGDIKDWENPWQRENCQLLGLPDWDQSNPEVTKYLLDVSKFWIKQTGADGFRLDTVKHAGHDFWKKYTREMHKFGGPDLMLIGEVFSGDQNIIASYQKDGFDSIFEFPLYYVIKDVFGQNQSMTRLSEFFGKDGTYPNAGMLSPFIDNHDIPRFINDAGNNGIAKLRMALSFIMTIRGIPTVYYGTETGLSGGGDPDNRKDMQWGDASNQQLTEYFKKLTSVRNTQIALRRGKQLEMWKDDDIYSFLRTTGDPLTEVITVLNNSEAQQTRTIQIQAESQMVNGTKLINLLGADGVTVNNKSITVTIGPKEAKIFAVVSIKKKSNYYTGNKVL